jgi:hypothetical protein
MLTLLVLALLGGPLDEPAAPPAGAGEAPPAGGVVVDTRAEEIRFPARVQHPKGKPCIDAWGQRIQAFLGTERANGSRSEFADYFVFLAGVETEEVYKGLAEIGLTTKVHFSREEGRQRGRARLPPGGPGRHLIRWKDGERWVERRYEDFVQEKAIVDGKEVVRPWTPQFVFHGSGVIHKEGTGCIACPCDCPGGIIADNRNPIYEPKPTVRFDLSGAPPEGTKVEVRIRPLKSKTP